MFWTYQHPEGRVGVCVNVRMSRLIDLEQDENRDGVHEGGVELEVRVVRANVVTPAHDSYIKKVFRKEKIKITKNQYPMLNRVILKIYKNVREPWSSGHSPRLTIIRSWVRTLALDNRWIIFIFICSKTVLFFIEKRLGCPLKISTKILWDNTFTWMRVKYNSE